MRERDIPYTAVSTPSRMLWEWQVIAQGLSNATATFKRCVTNLLRPVREFAPSYFDDAFVHSQAMDRKTDVTVHKTHVRQVLTLMLSHKLYAISRRVHSLQAKYHFLGASSVNTACALILKKSRQSPTGQYQTMSRD